MFIKNIKIFLSIFFVFSLILTVFSLDGYQRAFVVLRIKNFISVARLDSPSDIYSIPDSWLRYINSVYTPAEPNFPQQRNPVETDMDPNYSYRMDLMKSGLSQHSRDVYENSLNNQNMLSDCLLTIRQCLSYLPLKRSSFSIKEKDILLDRNGIELSSKILIGQSDKVLIALHGKGGSPEGVVCQIKDYANCFGAYWNKNGYTVYAPAVEGRRDWSVPRLNLDSISSDLAKIEDLILYIKSKHGNKTNIYIAGISYGANLAEYSAALFPDIDGLISIGGEARYIFGESEFSLPSKYIINTNRNRIRNGSIYQLISKNKPILISVGINDAGLFNDDGYGKLKIFRKLKNKKNIKFHFFNGSHEADPVQEFRIFSDMI